MKIGAIVQARVSSKRLPGKVLKELPYGSGITVLEQIIRRLKRAKKIDEIIVATSTKKCDDEIGRIAVKEKVKCSRGSQENVLSRYYLAARENKLDVVLRITGDCPCIDPEIVDLTVKRHIQTKADYTSNSLKRTYPVGLDVEIINFDVLGTAYKKSTLYYEKEHVTPYIYNHPDIFKITKVEAPKKIYAPDIRVTLDTEEDYFLLCVLFDYIYLKKPYFNAYDIVKFFKEKPWLEIINKKTAQKKIFTSLKGEINEAIKILDLQDLKRAKQILQALLK